MPKLPKPKPRRPRGSGSVSRRADGLFCGRLPRDPETGRREAVYGHSAAEVTLKLAERLVDRNRRIAPPERQLLRDYLPRWLAEVKRPRLEPASYAQYAAILRNHLRPGLGHLTLARLTPAAIQRFYAAKHRDGYSARSIRQMHLVLHSALQTAVRWGLLPRNPASLVDLPRVVKREVAVLDERPAQQFLASVRGHPLEALCVVALTAGLRLGELVGLRWQDVDFPRGLLHVRVKHIWVAGVRHENLPKGRKARDVELAPLAAEALHRHRAQQAEERLAVDTWARPELVFTGPAGQPLHQSSVSYWIPKLSQQAGLGRLTPHSLRHSYCSLLLKEGAPIEVAAQLLGHASVAFTLQTYRHLLPGETHAAVARLDARLRGEG